MNLLKHIDEPVPDLYPTPYPSQHVLHVPFVVALECVLAPHFSQNIGSGIPDVFLQVTLPSLQCQVVQGEPTFS